MVASEPDERRVVGRGAAGNPPNRYETTYIEADLEQLDVWEEDPIVTVAAATQLFPDRSRSIIASNDSPDVPFSYSVNPYRGCEHGCSYCYARPTHEQLGMSAGLDFETKIVVKYDAVPLLRDALAQPQWRGETIAMSGVTDCYQPIERTLKITRGVLEVMLEARQSVTIATKNALVLRDLDILVPLARQKLVQVALSITTLDAELARVLEPRTSTPGARLRAIRGLHEAGVPVSVLMAPVIPGLTDHEVADVLGAAAGAGAKSAGYVLLRLPLAVSDLFLAWLGTHRPLARRRVEMLIRATRGGELNESRCGSRMRGEAAYAEGIAASFRLFSRKFSLDGPMPPLDRGLYRPPRTAAGQQYLF